METFLPMCWRPENKLGQTTDSLLTIREPPLCEFFRLFFRGCGTVLLCLVLSPARAADAPVHECDRLAAHPHDVEKVAAGVVWESLDAQLALPACEAAAKDAPDVLRFQFQLARTLNKAGRLDEALRLYSELAETGYVAALMSLGMMYEEGLGVTQNHAEAARWYLLAAEKGNRVAQAGLGFMYLEGTGVPQDEAEAKKWMHMADAQGYGLVRAVLCRLTTNKTAEAKRRPILPAFLVLLPVTIILWRARSPSSYFRRHWRGDLPLAWSLWINCIVIYLVLGVALAWLGRSNHFSLPTTTAVSTALLLFAAALLPWQLVGCWRSAMFHIQITGRTVPARLAQALMLVGVLVVLDRAQTLQKQYLWVASVESDGYQVLLLGDGKEIEVCGTLVSGISKEVRKLLDRSPHVEILRLNSDGGWFREGEDLLELIEARGLITYSSTGCNSACTVAFVGGRSRVLNQEASLGFHATSSFKPRRERWKGQSEVAERLQNLAVFGSRGVDEEFVVKISDSPYDQMWYPTHKELLDAGFITRISDGADFAPHFPLP